MVDSVKKTFNGRGGWFMLATVLLCLAGLSAPADTQFIRLRNERIATSSPTRPAVSAQALEPAVSGLYLIQFEGVTQPAWRDFLRTSGVDLLRFVPENAFIVRLNQVRLSQLRALPFVRWVGPYRPEHKLHASLRSFALGATTNPVAAVKILLAPGTAPVAAVQVRRSLRTWQSETRWRFGAVLQGEVDATQLAALAQSPFVLWIEPAPRPKLLDEVAAKIVGGANPTSGHPTATQALGFDGRGVVVSIADSGINNGDAATMHPDLAGRVDAFLFYGKLTDAADEHGHGTHVSGIVAGNGATGETDDNGYLYGLGVASGAHLIAQRIFDGAGGFEPPDSNEVLTHDAVRAGAVIGSNSWGDDTQGRYDLSAAEFDALVRDADAETPGDQPYILEFSAGNAGPGTQTMGSPAVAKNVIATGASENDRLDLYIYDSGIDALADFSSRGPCEDGRIKPDVVAPGTWIASLQSASAPDSNAWMPISPNYQYQGGTSQAGPHVSGAAAVFVQYYRETHTNAMPSPALVKAALINCAVDMDDASGTGPTPNLDEGWGRVDLTRIIGSPRRYDYVDQTVSLATAQVYERRVVVASRDEPLKITLVYTDPPGLPAAIPALVNDLDLEVVSPDGTLYRGNQFEAGESAPNAPAADNINNVEAMHLRAPLPGEYVIRVRARNVVEPARADSAGVDQDFALVTSGDLPLPGVGILILDRAAYRAPDRIQLKLIDFDLSQSASVSVLVTSTTETNGETIVLQPVGRAGVFTGSVATVTGPAIPDGKLQIANGDVIEARYQDAAPASVRVVAARADLLPPVIAGVAVTNQFGKAMITWNTDEPANSLVRFGTNSILSSGSSNLNWVTEHEITLENLTEGATYWFAVVSTDEAGNPTTNDNNGAFYSFVVAPVATVLLVDAYESDLTTEDIPVTVYTEALDQTGVRYDVWSVSQLGRSPGTNDLQPYRVVMWRVTDSVYSVATLTSAQQAAIQAYVNRGGSFFLSSMEVLTRLGAVSFSTNVLHVLSFSEDAGVPSIVGLEQDPVTSGVNMVLDYSAYPTLDFLDLGPDFSDTITPTASAAPLLLSGGDNQVAGLKYPRTGQDSTGRVVFLSFPIDTVPMTGDPPNNRANLLRNILNFLAPGLNGLGTLALDSRQYTLPSKATLELADSDLAGQGQALVRFYSDADTNGLAVTLLETVRPGLFRGFVALVAVTNTPAPGQLRARQGDTVWAEYYDASTRSEVRATAVVDTQPPTIANIAVTADYEEATVSWDTSKPADALVQFGESIFLGRTAYGSTLETVHELTLAGLSPDRVYYYQVVSRDEAGNVAVDDNGGKFYTLHTLQPIVPPWSDNLEQGSTNWMVIDGEPGTTTWQLGVPNNGQETQAHSPTQAWGSNLNGDAIDLGDTSLIGPAIDLTGGNQAMLRFWHTYDFTPLSDMDIYEVGEVHVSTNGGNGWIPLAQFSETSAGWQEEEIDLTPYLGHVVRLGWYYGLFSLDTVARPGWLIDDVSVTVTNVPTGTVVVTNNLFQASFTLSGPVSRTGQGVSLLLTNAPLGEYTVTFGPVAFYNTPAAQTNTLDSTNTLVLSGQYTFADANSNGLSDAWELLFFGSVAPGRTPMTDTDRDGVPDLAEFMAGTDPTNATSFLSLLKPVSLSNHAVRLFWPAAVGHGYRVLGSTNAANWDPLTDWIRASVTNTSTTVSGLTNSSSYWFKLEVRP